MSRAKAFLPALAHVADPSGDRVRVGLRPFATGGLPLIGQVPGAPGGYACAVLPNVHGARPILPVVVNAGWPLPSHVDCLEC
eukprot:356737-Chlamydomonas_euryale.AAC.6